MSRTLRLAVVVVACILVAPLSAAQTLSYEYSAFLDTDDSAATGCAAIVGVEQFDGAEVLVTMLVDPASLTVTAVQEQTCQGGIWSPPAIIDNSGWPVGIDVGENGSDVVEGYVPITARRVRLGFAAEANLANDVLFTDEGGGPISLLLLGEIPMNSGPGIFVFIALMAVAGLMALRRGYGVVAVTLLCVSVAVAGARVLLACQADGNIGDWAGSQPVATDSVGDAIPDDPAADLVAAFVTSEPGMLCLRLDVLDLENRGIDIEKATNGHDADLAPGPSLNPGDPVTWTYVVTNTGIVQLHNIAVSDDKGVAVSCPRTTLDPGQSMTCTASGAAVPCPYANLGTVTALPPVGPQVSDSDPSHYSGGSSHPSIEIEKATNGHDADTAPGPTIVEGLPITWTYVVTNTGDATLSSVGITDDQGVTVSCPASVLAAGQTMVCTAAGTASPGQYSNMGTVTGISPCGDTVSDSDPSHYLGQALVASIRIEKATNGHDADTAPGPSLSPGDPVTWTYVVTNTGDLQLSGISITDDQGVAVSCPVSSLSAGQSMTCTASGTAAAGQYANLGSVTGQSPSGQIVTDSDPSHYLGSLPALAGKIAINEIGVNPALDGRSFVEFLSLSLSAADTTAPQMQQLGLYIVGQDGQVVRINEGFISNTLPAQGTMVAYEDGVFEIRNSLGNLLNIGSDAYWADYAEVYIGGAWVTYDPAIHDFAFGDTTADPVLVNLQQSGISIDLFVANDPYPDVSPAEVMSGIWKQPAGAPAPEGDFSSFDGSFTDDTVFARVFVAVGTQPFVIEPGEIDSDTAVDWTTNSTPTIASGGLNPTQVAGANPDNDDGQTVLFGTESGDVIEGEEGPDFLFGRDGEDSVAGGGGNDLVGGGPGDDVLSGGAGDDGIDDTDSDFDTPGGLSVVNGGSGIDSFGFADGGDAASLQLTNSTEVTSRLTAVEILDMSDGDGLDSLTLTTDVANALGDSNDAGTMAPAVSGEQIDIFVTGDAAGSADTVNLQGSGWALDFGTTVTIGTDTFDIWIDSSGVAIAVVAIEQGLAVNSSPP